MATSFAARAELSVASWAAYRGCRTVPLQFLQRTNAKWRREEKNQHSNLCVKANLYELRYSFTSTATERELIETTIFLNDSFLIYKGDKIQVNQIGLHLNSSWPPSKAPHPKLGVQRMCSYWVKWYQSRVKADNVFTMKRQKLRRN